MVDIGATTPTAASRRHAALDQPMAETTISVLEASADALAAYEDFCRDAIHAPAQHPHWVRSWTETANRDALIIFIESHGRQVAALALEVVRQGPFRVARFMGGKHANGNFIATRRGGAPLTSHDLRRLTAAIREVRPDIDIVALERQNPEQDGAANPLATLATGRSPNVSLSVNLDGGFDAMLSRRSGKRKKKKYKLQLRKFEEAGGHRLIEAASPEEVERLIGDFYIMKAARFRKKGIPDVFGSPEVRAFFRALYLNALADPSPAFALHGVEVAGVLRAVNGVSVGRASVVCEFGGIRDDELNASPGFFLDYTNIEQACANGKRVYDFSVGDEEYKRSWCDIETWQFDVLLPLTLKGRLAYGIAQARARAVAYVKSNDRLWGFIKGLRQKRGQETAGDDS